MRILIFSMPLVAMVTILAMTATRIQTQEPTLRESILPETLALMRSMDYYHRTIAEQIDEAERRGLQPTTKIHAATASPTTSSTWSAGNWVSAE